MPEGPEIHRTADHLAAAVLHQPLVHVEFAFPALHPFERKLRGRAVVAVTARGKALLTAFDDGWTLYSHNQLYGVWKIAPAGTRPATKRSLRVVLETAKTAILLYSASDIEMWRSAEIESHPFLRHLGPDVLDPGIDVAAVETRLRLPAFCHRELGGLLLDQGFLAGLGNYLRCEVLFAARLHPAAHPCDLDGTRLHALAEACLAIARLSYATRGVEPRPGMHPGYQAHEGKIFHFHVFKRAGEPCERCGTPIAKVPFNSRPLFYCPRCQRA
ncbi:MAG TPA: endonuclease VIII [Rhodanobacteraceae bacterium]|nr:endonuclease VIII [Rhodanobacteraceae bacterium]